jgi:hypothetical protein
MSLTKILNYLNEYSRIKIRRVNVEITLSLDEDIIKIYPENKRAEFLDIDSADEITIKDKYYENFPELKHLFKELIKEGYDIQP